LFLKTNKYLRWMLMVGCLCCSFPASAADKLVLNIGLLHPYSTRDENDFIHTLIAALSRELELPIELLIYQGAYERELINANQGVEDGIAARTAGIEKRFPNLIRVPEEILTIEIVAFTTAGRIAIPNWEALSPYVVGYVSGWNVVESRRSSFLEATPVSDAEHLFKLLGAGRADVVIYERLDGLAQAKTLGIKVQPMSPPLASTKLYTYLHKKHAALVPKMTEALVKLKRNGTYKRLYDAMLAK
jgi:polar amino acid transport system substrate-binding protein